MKRIIILLTLILGISVLQVSANELAATKAMSFALDGKKKSKAPKVKKPKPEHKEGTSKAPKVKKAAREPKKGKSKAPKVKKAEHEPRKGKSKAPKVKKPVKGKNYTKHDNYP